MTEDLQNLYSFLGYLVRAGDDDLIGPDKYDGTIEYADNVFIVDYSDKEFMGSFYHQYGVDLYTLITKLPALVVIDLDAIKFSDAKPILGKDRTVVQQNIIKVVYGNEILEKYAIFNQSDINRVYFSFPPDENGTVQKRIIQYFDDKNERTQCGGFAPVPGGM